MALTDDDLKRLKNCLPKEEVAGGLTVAYGEWKALLDRLEAAELTIRHFAAYLPLPNLESCETYQAWRKAAGK